MGRWPRSGPRARPEPGRGDPQHDRQADRSRSGAIVGKVGPGGVELAGRLGQEARPQSHPPEPAVRVSASDHSVGLVGWAPGSAPAVASVAAGTTRARGRPGAEPDRPCLVGFGGETAQDGRPGDPGRAGRSSLAAELPNRVPAGSPAMALVAGQ